MTVTKFNLLLLGEQPNQGVLEVSNPFMYHTSPTQKLG